MSEEQVIHDLLVSIGIDLGNEHTVGTPVRLLNYLSYWAKTQLDVPFVPTTFANKDPKVDEMVTIGPISFWSCCSHHLLPFHGHAWVAYLPNEHIIGLSKVSQAVRWLARKPQVQEHLTDEVANFMEIFAKPNGVAVRIKAWHTCQFLSVGPDAPQMVTTALRGDMHRDRAQAEFLQEVNR